MVDPIALKNLLWPDVVFYREQTEIIYSVWNNKETVVTAGNLLGKDFVAGFIVLAYFLSRHPCRIVTTSVKEEHLDVLWGEIEKFIRIAKYPLLASEGGPLLINADGLRKIVGGVIHKDSYAKRMVASNKTLQSFQGHHVTPDPGQPIDNVPRNLYVADEASGVPDAYYTMSITWATRILQFGNPWPCENSFRHAVTGCPGTDDVGGDIQREDGSYIRRVISIKAVHSPNVRLGLAEICKGFDAQISKPSRLTNDLGGHTHKRSMIRSIISGYPKANPNPPSMQLCPVSLHGIST